MEMKGIAAAVGAGMLAGAAVILAALAFHFLSPVLAERRERYGYRKGRI